jgi:cytochrome c
MHMTFKLNVILALALTAASGFALAADGGATKEDATAMVKKGVAAIKAGGADKTYTEINDKANATWHHMDLYLTVYGLDGTVKAHGANAKMIGKNLIELKDIDGKAFVKERMDMAKSHANFWQDYKFTNPETKKIEPKEVYCEKLDDTVVCGGIYK